ncbi:L,D-transpeptidase [Thalassobellus suaedae]|uniref:L,D-transpeptidase n=1 Tax=Thalassobellus suaedae TaxID=3074124 RepID=A0ABY9XXI5_9FLAO|nr:L,D-transpeptidase [Flavobacteriaceae bacterium HL-DH14]
MLSKFKQLLFFGLILLAAITFYSSNKNDNLKKPSNIIVQSSLIKYISIVVDKPITIEHYFQFLDSIVNKYDSVTSYKLSEHLLVRANSWIIDTLKNTDYYIMKARDSFIYNQKKMIVIPKGTYITIPDSTTAIKLLNSFKKTTIDINIPEFKLRIYEDLIKLYEFPIRVGRNENKYLKMAGRVLDLKTKTGSGFIVRHVRNPSYYNPVNGTIDIL